MKLTLLIGVSLKICMIGMLMPIKNCELDSAEIMALHSAVVHGVKHDTSLRQKLSTVTRSAGTMVGTKLVAR